MKRIAIIVTLTFVLFGFSDSKKDLAIQKVKGLFTSTQSISTMSYEFIRTERIDGELVKNHSKVKMQRKPYSIYVQEIAPNAGLEILYPDPQEENKALINPNGFPWINLRLDPMGDLMRKGQHHTVHEGGYDYIVSVMEYIFYKYRTRLTDIVAYDGISIYNGRSCDMITLHNPGFKYINYTVSKGETVTSIATKYRLNEYMIMEKNKGLGFSSSLRAGDIIKIPSDYSSSMTICVDRERQIPLSMKIYDDEGLFEHYEFKNVEINPNLRPEEFSDSFTAYNFN
ncbi:MAG: DUF1571 domain-containing protein [Reichenbachiella sp.]